MRKPGVSAATALSICAVILIGASTPVLGYCPTECKRIDPKVGYCIEFGPVGAGCTENSTGSANIGGSYGAIAYSPASGEFGYSDKYANRAQAESRAKQECGKSDCQVVVWYYNKCGALATDDDGAWGADNGDDGARANQAALAKCAEEHGKNCKVIASYCSR